MSDYTPALRQLMVSIGCSSYKALSQKTKLSWRQLQALRFGQGSKLSLDSLLRLSQAFGITLPELLATFDINVFSIPIQESPNPSSTESSSDALQSLKEEYIRLQRQLEQQRSQLLQDFQRETLNTLESLLLIWPTAAHAAQQNPTAPAVKLLPLLKPIEQLLRNWGIEAIGEVGQITKFDPTLHQSIAIDEGDAPQPGDPAIVTHVGYRQNGIMLYRAKTKPTPESA